MLKEGLYFLCVICDLCLLLIGLKSAAGTAALSLSHALCGVWCLRVCVWLLALLLLL
jgi:hypothetical protein